jgi:hypothetical protein
MTSTLPALLLVAVVGCGGTDQVYDAGADPGDTSTEPPPETTPDITPESTHDLPPDTPHDTPRDEMEEEASTGCTPLTDEGICNIIEQCGCSEGAWCGLRFDDLTCTYFEDCIYRPPGGVGPEGTCFESFPMTGECQPGTACFWIEHMYSYRCNQFCLTDGDCSVEGRTCSETLSYSDMYCPTPVELPYRACSMS